MAGRCAGLCCTTRPLCACCVVLLLLLLLMLRLLLLLLASFLLGAAAEDGGGSDLDRTQAGRAEAPLWERVAYNMTMGCERRPPPKGFPQRVPPRGSGSEHGRWGPHRQRCGCKTGDISPSRSFR